MKLLIIEDNMMRYIIHILSFITLHLIAAISLGHTVFLIGN